MSPHTAVTASGQGSRRHLAWLLLVGVVTLLHLGLVTWVADNAFDLEGSASGSGLARMKAVFVVELAPTAPLPDAPRVVAPVSRRAAAAPSPPAASAAASAASPVVARAPEPPAAEAPPPAADPAVAVAGPAAPELAADGTPVVPLPAPAPPPDASAVAAAPSASAPVTIDWPRSTQLTYKLSGNYRGPVDGQASVQWLREGSRYQVHLEVSVGPSFAPMVSRRMSSDGEIGPDGLTPRRYEEETRLPLRDPRRLTMLFEGAMVRLANGSEVPRPAGVQDSASQFVQLTWLFTLQPDLLRRGRSVDLMLALPRRVEPWTYDVLDSEPLTTPAGVIQAVHVRPRRPARPGDLTAEMWSAPSLQYLPVRIVIRQDSETWVDLLIDRLPVQAAEGAPR